MSPDREITLNGKALRLRFGMRAYAALQEYYGAKSLVETAARLTDIATAKVEDIVAAFWAATRTHHPELSKEDVLDLIDGLSFGEIASEIEKTLSAGAPPREGGEARPQTGSGAPQA